MLLPHLGVSSLTNDQYFNNVSLLLSARDGQIKDYSKYSRSISIGGNASISNSQTKWGNKSIYLDGTGDSLTLSASTDFAFGTGDFTIEMWLYLPSSLTMSERIICTRATQLGASGTWGLSLDSSLKLSFTEIIVGEPSISTANNALTLNSFNFISISRASGVLTISVNGVSKASGTFNNNLNNSSYPLYIGISPNESDINAYYDNLRITKGIARSIQVPTQPFSNW